MRIRLIAAVILIAAVLLLSDYYFTTYQHPQRVTTLSFAATTTKIYPTITFDSQVWRVLFNASFESGNITDYFNDSVVTTCGAVDNITSTMVHSGHYAEIDYYDGGSCGENIRAYPTESITNAPTDFYLNLWVYVPQAKLTDWVSFITLHLSDDTFITLDSNTQRQLHLWNKITGITYQSGAVTWPFSEWFELGIRAHIQPGTLDYTIVVYQNNTPIISYTGDTGNGQLAHVHLGLYAGPNQGDFTVYNDDLLLMVSNSELG